MNIGILGIGKLGLCFALTLERAGYNVIGVDINKDYIEQINNKSLKSSEENVENYLKLSKNFYATIDLFYAINNCKILFIIVATPSLQNGEYDHSQIESLIDKIKLLGKQKQEKHLVVCSTTMPEYCDTIQEKLKNYNYTISYNPEFIAQGTILKNQEKPDMVLIGEGSPEAGDIIESIYKKHTTNNPSIHRMSRTEAELCKISLNCFLTTKIAYANMIGDIAIRAKCNPEKILKAIGSDSRIGSKYLNYGYGFGGPCFPRDNRALSIFAENKNIDAIISKASDKSNEKHLNYQIENFISENQDKTKQIFFDYVTYKKESILLTESQQLKFAIALKNLGYNIVIKDSREEVIKQLESIL
jgi:UDPglucose 6-dehydrogenase